MSSSGDADGRVDAPAASIAAASGLGSDRDFFASLWREASVHQDAPAEVHHEVRVKSEDSAAAAESSARDKAETSAEEWRPENIVWVPSRTMSEESHGTEAKTIIVPVGRQADDGVAQLQDAGAEEATPRRPAKPRPLKADKERHAALHQASLLALSVRHLERGGWADDHFLQATLLSLLPLHLHSREAFRAHLRSGADGEPPSASSKTKAAGRKRNREPEARPAATEQAEAGIAPRLASETIAWAWQLVSWLRSRMRLEPVRKIWVACGEAHACGVRQLLSALRDGCGGEDHLVFLSAALLRAVGIETRIIASLSPAPLRAVTRREFAAEARERRDAAASLPHCWCVDGRDPSERPPPSPDVAFVGESRVPAPKESSDGRGVGMADAPPVDLTGDDAAPPPLERDLEPSALKNGRKLRLGKRKSAEDPRSETGDDAADATLRLRGGGRGAPRIKRQKASESSGVDEDGAGQQTAEDEDESEEKEDRGKGGKREQRTRGFASRSRPSRASARAVSYVELSDSLDDEGSDEDATPKREATPRRAKARSTPSPPSHAPKSRKRPPPAPDSESDFEMEDEDEEEDDDDDSDGENDDEEVEEAEERSSGSDSSPDGAASPDRKRARKTSDAKAPTGDADDEVRKDANEERVEAKKPSRTKKLSDSSPRNRSPRSPKNAAPITVSTQWLEIFSPELDGWIHVDPVLCLVDEPLRHDSAANTQSWTHSLDGRTAVLEAHRLSYVIACGSTVPAAADSGPGGKSSSLSSSSEASAKGRLSLVRRRDRDAATSAPAATFPPAAARYLRDVTRRYSALWSQTAALRGDEDWWKDALARLSRCYGYGGDGTREVTEDAALTQHIAQEGVPRSLSKLKNHPLYAIEAHLLKFQTIYPRGREHVVSTINVRGKEIDVYPRSHVHTLHTRDRWVREMRQVRDGEAPLKRVKKLVSRWKATRVNDTGAEAAVEDDKADDELNDLFGFWQTDPFNPGEAHEGKVPKNERGHVDLWTPDHLPRGCVHVRLPRVVAAARKAKIDYAPAMTGFSVHCGWSVPVIDGIVICAEDEPKLLEEFYRSERQREVRAEQRRLERVFAGWRRVVRPLLVKARVAAMMDEAGDFGQGPAPISLQ